MLRAGVHQRLHTRAAAERPPGHGRMGPEVARCPKLRMHTDRSRRRVRPEVARWARSPEQVKPKMILTLVGALMALDKTKA